MNALQNVSISKNVRVSIRTRYKKTYALQYVRVTIRRVTIRTRYKIFALQNIRVTKRTRLKTNALYNVRVI